MINPAFAQTPEPPYYAVIFSAQRNGDDPSYDHTAKRMAELAAQQPGFLGLESVRGPDGFGISVSYWTDLDSITAWKHNSEHQSAQESGKRNWYAHFNLRIARVERASSW